MATVPDTSPESSGQLIVALAIVGGTVAIGLSLIAASVITKNPDYAKSGVGTILGGLFSALNAPSGIGKVLQAARAPPPELRTPPITFGPVPAPPQQHSEPAP